MLLLEIKLIVLCGIEKGFYFLNHLLERKSALIEMVIIELLGLTTEHNRVSFMVDVWRDACLSAEVSKDL